MKNFLSNLWKKIKSLFVNLWEKADELTKKVIPQAVAAVQWLKNFNDSDLADVTFGFITSMIKGQADDIAVAAIRTKLRTELPKILMALNIVKTVNEIRGIDKQIIELVKYIKFSKNDAEYDEKCRTLAGMLASAFADGNISFKEAADIAAYYYDNYVK